MTSKTARKGIDSAVAQHLSERPRILACTLFMMYFSLPAAADSTVHITSGPTITSVGPYEVLRKTEFTLVTQGNLSSTFYQVSGYGGNFCICTKDPVSGGDHGSGINWTVGTTGKLGTNGMPAYLMSSVGLAYQLRLDPGTSVTLSFAYDLNEWFGYPGSPWPLFSLHQQSIAAADGGSTTTSAMFQENYLNDNYPAPGDSSGRSVAYTMKNETASPKVYDITIGAAVTENLCLFEQNPILASLSPLLINCAIPIQHPFPYSQHIETAHFGDGLPAGIPSPLGAVASSGLPVSVSTNTPDICSVNDNIVTGISPGSCNLYVEQTGNMNVIASQAQDGFSGTGPSPLISAGAFKPPYYLPAPPQTVTINILPAPPGADGEVPMPSWSHALLCVGLLATLAISGVRRV